MNGPRFDRWLLPNETAELLSVNPKTVARWAKEGKLPFLSTLGGHRRYRYSDILKIRERLTEPVTDPWQGGER